MDFDATEAINALAKLPPVPPKAPERSAWSALPRAVAGAAAQMFGQAEQALTIKGMEPRRPADDPIQIERDKSQRAREEHATRAIDYERSLRPDPATASTAEQVVYGLTKGLTKAVGAVATAGPAGGAAIFGGSEAAATYDDLTREGVDKDTALKAAGVAGVVNAAGVLLPMSGPTLKATAGLYAIGGPGGFMAQQAATREILRNANYAAIAERYDPTDMLGLGLAIGIPLPFAGAGALRNIRGSTVAKGAPAAPALMPADNPVPVSGSDHLLQSSSAPAVPGTAVETGQFAAKSGVYAVSDAISADGPTGETVRLVVRPDGSAVIQRENGDLIDVTNMVRAGFTAERAIAQSIGDDTSGANVRSAKAADVPPAADAAPVVEPVPDAAPRVDAPEALPVAEPPRVELPQETIDAAMVHNLTVQQDFAESVKADVQFKGPVTENPNFKAWFSESRVVTPEGKPQVVYHGTAGSFDAFGEDDMVQMSRGLFRTKRDASGNVIERPANEVPDGRFFFTDSPQVAADYATGQNAGGVGANVMPAYVALRNPLIVDGNGVAGADRFTFVEDAIGRANSGGHDGVVIRNVVDVLPGADQALQTPQTVYVAFRRDQIKSAIGNSGRFDPQSGSLTDPLPQKSVAELLRAEVPIEAPGKSAADATADAVQSTRTLTEKDLAGTQQPQKPQTPEALRMMDERVKNLEAEKADMPVKVTEDGQTVTVAEEMARIRREIDEGTDVELGRLDADLVRVAAECALSLGQV